MRLSLLLFLFPILLFSQTVETGHFEGEAIRSESCVPPAERVRIEARLTKNLTRLAARGLLPPLTRNPVQFDWPLRPAAGLDYDRFSYISNYVDHDPLSTGSQYAGSNEDYACGDHTYDTANGYNHSGTDISVWPFNWRAYEQNQLEVVAAAPGILVFREDAQPDDNCSCEGQWNAVYIRHDDGTTAWYGHLKQNTLTEKDYGERVARGEYLGIMASSGCSTGPHLHFEVLDADDNIIDPFAGNCNATTAASRWNAQPAYRPSAVTTLMTHSGLPEFGCRAEERAYEKRVFYPGDALYLIAYFQDLRAGQIISNRLLYPDGTSARAWTTNASTTYRVGFYYWNQTSFLTASKPFGTYTYAVDFEGETSERHFEYRETALVELSELEARRNGNESDLRWTAFGSAAGEEFVVERSRDRTTWEEVARLPQSGSSDETRVYEVVDTAPYSGINVYRIRQREYTGQKVYSNEADVHFAAADGTISVLPNPVRENLVIEAPDEARVRIYDTTGRLHLDAPATDRIYALGHLARGVYVVRIALPDEEWVRRIVLQ